MPDSGVLPAALARPAARRIRRRWVSPLLQRILLVNALPLALLVAALLYLDQYQAGLLEANVQALREQARIFAGALGESAVREPDPDNPVLQPDQARPLLRRLTEPTPNAQARLFAPDGRLIADSRVRDGAGGAVVTEPLPPAVIRSPVLDTVHGLRQVDVPVAAQDAGPLGRGQPGGRGGLAARREGGAAHDQLQHRARDAALYPPDRR